MSVTSILYNLFIYPPAQIIEIAYMLFYKVFKNTSIAVLGVSVAVTFLCLPLYVVAEKWQKTERETQKRMDSMVKNIKSVYKGDERFLLLSEFYRQNHYHPIYSLRTSFGILIQIPFFIAAYSYLSNLESLKGVSFLFIRDLSSPDAIIKLSDISINILPIVMTIINIVSGVLYTRGFPLKEKFQLFGMAGIFLLLLYNSPAGLLIYWTMNNILSLVKNIFYKLKNPLKVLYICICILASIFILYLLFFNTGVFRKRLLLSSIISVIFFIPLFIKIINYIYKNLFAVFTENSKLSTILFFSGSITLALLMGICIPSMVFSSSPEEFCFIDNYTSPWVFIFTSLFQSFGFFFIWPSIIYFLYKNKVRTILAFLFIVIGAYAVVNTFIFQGSYGKISNTLLFTSPGVLTTSKLDNIFNIAALIILVIFFLYLIKIKKKEIINSIMIIIISFLCLFSIYNIFLINRGYQNAVTLEKASGGSIHRISPIFSLSKTENNVIVLMQDAAVSGFLKPIFEEHPQLEKQFDGFTFYPNTLSFGSHTLLGAPPIWGGYEYTPEEMNKNPSRPLVEKHNEALMVLPVLLEESGFDVCVADQSWANYSWIADLSIYNSTNIKTASTLKMYTNLWFMENDTGKDDITSKKIIRNTFWFSLLKISPPFLRIFIYDESVYWSPENQGESIVGFINSYAFLHYLPKLTTYDSTVPSALLLTNEIIHESIFLQYPDYIPVAKVTDIGNGKFSTSTVYHANNAFYLKFGEFLEELKKNDVYDNTRIIIVADHGQNLNAVFKEEIPFLKGRREWWNPLLLIKDFNSRGPLKTDMSFMTNADVPFLVSKDLISNPVNPFTGKRITMDKNNGVIITNCHIFMPYQHSKNKFNITDDQWIKVHDNIFDPANWSKIQIN